MDVHCLHQDYSMYIESIDEAFLRLESAFVKLAYKLKNVSVASAKAGRQYEEAVKMLATERSSLEQQLSDERLECERWTRVHDDVMKKLTNAIKTICSILGEEVCLDE